jgi:hypothetical protein
MMLYTYDVTQKAGLLMLMNTKLIFWDVEKSVGQRRYSRFSVSGSLGKQCSVTSDLFYLAVATAVC